MGSVSVLIMLLGSILCSVHDCYHSERCSLNSFKTLLELIHLLEFRESAGFDLASIPPNLFFITT